MRYFLLLSVLSLLAFLSPVADSSRAAFPGANGKIAYQIADEVTFDLDIWVMNANDTGHANITNTTGYDSEAAWSPDGSKIAFSSDRSGGNTDIWVMNSNGGNPLRLTDDAAIDYAPTWSPNAAKIAFSSNRDGDSDIYVMNADGTNEVNVSNNTAGDGQSAWSPDGTRFAFTRVGASPCDAGSQEEIWVMNAGGGGATQLSCQLRARSPEWSPDGTKIAFEVGIGTGVQVFVMNANGSGQTAITEPTSSNPAWSPDGTKVLFNGYRGGPSPVFGLFTVNPDGSGETVVTGNGGENPSWQQNTCAAGDWDCDGVTGEAEGQCGDMIDSDDNGLVNDGCPQVGAAAESGAGCGNAADDDGDGWINDGCPGATEIVACGANAIGPSSVPERTDTPGDDDGDTLVNEPLPPGAQAFDCDGDGYIGSREGSITTSDQDPCGGTGWPSDLLPGGLFPNTLTVQDVASFVTPVRRLGTSLGDQNFSARWDLVPGSVVGATINVQDIIVLVTGATGYPPMFGGQRAFGNACPYPP